MSKRLTISMPAYVYQQLKKLAPKGKISQFVTEAVEVKLLKEKLDRAREQQAQERGESAVERFLALRDELPKFTDEEIKAAIEKGRM